MTEPTPAPTGPAPAATGPAQAEPAPTGPPTTPPAPAPPPPSPAATPLAGVLVGHHTDSRRPTGVTVVILPEGSTAGVDVRGAAPGTRETDLLDPVNTVRTVDAIMLAGGSAYGLDAAAGVMRWLEEHGRGVDVGPARVPIVPAAVIFDLDVGDASVRPDAAAGAAACASAVPIGAAEQGSVGAGAGATVGKLLGPAGAMRGGLGIAHLSAHGVTMAAVIVVNAVGDVVDPRTGTILAGARGGGLDPVDTVAMVLGNAPPTGPAAPPDPTAAPPTGPAAGAHTTIGVLVTDARLSKAQATRLAQVAHDGLARTIRPVHTPMDGDTLFAAATGSAPWPDPSATEADDRAMFLLSTMAAEVTADAVQRAIRAATTLTVGDRRIPAWRDRGAEPR